MATNISVYEGYPDDPKIPTLLIFILENKDRGVVSLIL